MQFRDMSSETSKFNEVSSGYQRYLKKTSERASLKREYFKVYVTSTISRLVKETAYLFGLPVSQYVKYLLIKDISSLAAKNQKEELNNLKLRLLKNRMDD